MWRFIFLAIIYFSAISSGEIKFDRSQYGPIKGLTIVAPPSKFSVDPFPRVKETNTEWVAFVPYAYQRIGSVLIHYNVDRQWWGEKEEGIRESIKLAKKKGLKVMVKPQVYIPGSWPGDVDFDTEDDWMAWESAYRDYIEFYVALAIEEDVEMICIGTEYEIASQKREAFWRKLIKDIRKDYNGYLTYSANWDSFKEIPYWSALDFIGISAYFPLDDSRLPKESDLKNLWKPKVRDLKWYAYKNGKPILFTEYGYLSVDHCAGETWNLEKNINNLKVNEKAQARALNALYSVFWEEKFWAGGFLWKWFPNMEGHEGYPAKDYTPQDKQAEEILKKWYSK